MRRLDEQHSVRAPHTLPSHETLTALLQQTRNLNVDFTDFCRTIGDEPAISSQILRTARSVLVSREVEVSELRQAIAMIGLRKVESILQSLEVDATSTLDAGTAAMPNSS
jgi:HD-like signal output (HDOD) protein